MQFDEFWARALALFGKFLGQAGKNGREERLFISSWRPGKGFSDEEFPVRDVYPDRITCLSIHAGKAIEIPRDDMKTLYALWDDF